MSVLTSVELLGGVVLLLASALVAVAVRRRALQRGGGSIDLSLQLRTLTHGRGWVLGVGRFERDELQWFRVLSLARGPRRTLRRTELTVVAQRPPSGAETLSLPTGSVVLQCSTTDGGVLLGMELSAATGLLAWLESAPPGSRPAR